MKIILVDQSGREIGTCDKLEAHKKGLLHRAFSVFIFNKKGELLIQKRALSKYHSAGKWSNTCCSHPVTGNIRQEAEKRLEEEMGISAQLREAFCFVYREDVGNNMIEHEYDYVFIGYSDDEPKADPKEVNDWKWVSMSKLRHDIKKNPEKYTPWLRISIEKFDFQ